MDDVCQALLCGPVNDQNKIEKKIKLKMKEHKPEVQLITCDNTKYDFSNGLYYLLDLLMFNIKEENN